MSNTISGPERGHSINRKSGSTDRLVSDLASSVRQLGDPSARSRRKESDALRAELGMPRKKKKKKSNLHLLLFPLVCVYYEVILRLLGGNSFPRGSFYSIWFGFGFGLILTALVTLLKRRSNRRLAIVILFLLALFYTTECMVHESFQMYMTWKQIFAGTKDVMTGYSSDLIKAVLAGIPRILLFFWPWILYVWIGRRKLPARRYPPAMAGLLVVVSLIMGGAGSLAAAHGSISDAYGINYDFDTATSLFGLLTSTKLNLKYAVFGNKQAAQFVSAGLENPEEEESEGQEGEPASLPVVQTEFGDNVMDLNFIALAGAESNEDVKMLDTYASAVTPSNKNIYTGLFKGKNLILICAEAFCDAFVDPELTPTMYRMLHNGFYFSDFYQPTWGGSTSTGEFSMVMGLAPEDGIDSIKMIKDNNNYFTMGNQLQRLGYWSCAYHNGTFDYYDRNITHMNLGYDNFLAQGNGLEEICGRYPGDNRFFDKTLDVYMDQQPFSIYYMTVSGHAPYVSESPYVTTYLDQVKSIVGDRYKKTTLYYICFQMELEAALTTMVAKLEEKGIADDTVIVMTGDHYPYGLRKSDSWGNKENYVEDLYRHPDVLDWDRDKNGLIIWSGCLEHEYQAMAKEISTPTFSLDILPTLSNLFGLEYDSRLLVGRDVFSEQEPLVFWNDRSWATVRGKYDAKNKVYTPNGGYSEDDEYVEQVSAVVNNKILFSEKVVDTDYYRNLFGADPDSKS